MECSSSSQLFVLQKIQEQVYTHFNVKKDFASHSDLDGETKIKLKGQYIICNGCIPHTYMSTPLSIPISFISSVKIFLKIYVCRFLECC